MIPIKVAEGAYTPYMYEHHFFRVYLADNPDDVANMEQVSKSHIHLAGTISTLKCDIYLVHFIQDSSD